MEPVLWNRCYGTGVMEPVLWNLCYGTVVLNRELCFKNKEPCDGFCLWNRDSLTFVEYVDSVSTYCFYVVN